jgi:hypothetical protein
LVARVDLPSISAAKDWEIKVPCRVQSPVEARASFEGVCMQAHTHAHVQVSL